MRNLMQFPITDDEIVDCLRTFQEALPKDLIGDMRGVLLDAAIERVRGRVHSCHQR